MVDAPMNDATHTMPLISPHRSLAQRLLHKPISGDRLRAGQHAVITGGSSGLGLELAVQLTRRGLAVTLVAQDCHRLKQAQEHVSANVPAAIVQVCSVDVTNSTATRTALHEVGAASGSIDLLINSAGILREGYFERLDQQDFRAVMDVNFFGVLNTTTACLPYLKQSRGRIVNIGSMAGLVGVFGLTAYGAAKHALTGFTDALRLELEPQGVTVQLVCPPEFASPMVDALNSYRTPENRAQAGSVPALGVAQVAKETIRGIESGDQPIVPGAISRLVWRTSRFAPGLMRHYFQRRLASVYRGPTTPDLLPALSI